MADKDVKTDVKPDVKDDKGADEPYLGTYKTKEEAETGLTELNSKLGTQGSELGTAKKMLEFTQKQLEKAQAQPKTEPKAKEETPAGPDFGKEMGTIQKKIAELDNDEPGYQKDLAGLMAKSTSLAMQVGAQQGAKTALDAAQVQFKEALDERDITSTHKDFFRDNPDFNTPEMQVRIEENLANDQTGMSDPMVAYREIQRDDAAQAATVLEEENVELKRLLDLKKGEEETGKVVTKAGSSTQQKTKLPKATGAELDKGMQGALDALRT